MAAPDSSLAAPDSSLVDPDLPVVDPYWLVADAELPSLLATLAHLNRDESFVPADLWLDPARMQEPNGGWDDAQTARAGDLARTGILLWLNEGLDRGSRCDRGDPAGDASADSKATLRSALIKWLTGTELDGDYLAMLTEELGLSGAERTPQAIATETGPAPGGSPTVAIIGAGMSGILAAHRLQQAGVPCVVLEKNDEVGGTWFENSYPGCRVDVFNHVYSYSFEQKPDWPEYHSQAEVLLDYFCDCADRWGVRSQIRFGTAVRSMAWDESRSHWQIDLDTPQGPETLTCNAVISAVGQLNRPKMPQLRGMESFAGESFHSSAWRHDLDLAGRNVAVIGTGASAMQFIPEVAAIAGHVSVFQRTPAWLIPRPEYHEQLPAGLLRLFELIPEYANWFRLRLFWRTHEGSVAALRRSADWTGALESAVSHANDAMRQLLTMYLEQQFGDRPDLLSQVLPRYPVGAKRVVLDNGIWARTLRRDNVSLVGDPITALTPEGVLCGDDEVHRADVIIYATGFEASSFLTPMQVRGRQGLDLHQQWGSDACAYLGISVAGFPNLFCLYGPNTNIVVNGSIIYFSECEVHYIIECLRQLRQHRAASMECRREVYDAYAARVDAANSEMAWGISTVNSWYKSASGRGTQNWPFPLLDFWRQTRACNPDDYIFR